MKNVTVGTAAVAMQPGMTFGQARTDGKPNVVILFIDDLGYGDLGCFGNKNIPTPHIDSMAENGVRCTMSYITNPPCSPSRCALMTGMYTQRFGKSGMARGMPIPEDHPTMGEFMRDAGYVTGQIGKWDLGSPKQGPHVRGFMEVARYAPGGVQIITLEDGSKGFRTELDGDYMVEFVERNKDTPFFLYFSPNAVHSPVKNTPKSYQQRIKKGNKAYGGAVAAVDDAVGKLLSALKKHNLTEKTLIFLTGDNGANERAGGSSAPYSGGKGAGTQKDGWVHTPTIAYWPGTIPGGKTYEGLMCTLDFYATAAAVAGGELPERCDGVNLLPYLQGKKKGDAHEEIYWHNADKSDAPRRNLRAMRWKDWRLVDNRLYDLRKDPQERSNLASEHPEVVADMKKRLNAWVKTLPPLIPGGAAGPLCPPPAGWGWIIGDGKGSGKGGTEAPEEEMKAPHVRGKKKRKS